MRLRADGKACWGSGSSAIFSYEEAARSASTHATTHARIYNFLAAMRTLNVIALPKPTEAEHALAFAPDLVDRLRDYHTEDEMSYWVTHPICDEAADEIERLRALLAEAGIPCAA